MFLQSRVSRLLAQLRAAGQLLGAPRPWPGPSAGATRTRSSACGPPASLSAHHPRARTSAGVGAWGAAPVGRRAGVRTWAPLAMAAKVDLSTSTDWKEAKSFLKGLSDKQREEHYFCRDFVRLKKIPTWKETAKGVTVKVEEPKYKKDKQLNEKISLFRGDITKLEVDAIVNAGGVCLAEVRSGVSGGGQDQAAGPRLRGQCHRPVRLPFLCPWPCSHWQGCARCPADSRAVLAPLGSVAYGELCGSDRAGGLRSAVELLDFLRGWSRGHAILPGPCSSCGDRGGGGLQGGWKGLVRERGPHPRSPLHPEELPVRPWAERPARSKAPQRLPHGGHGE
ncbi:hypothetical protein FD755_012007 [Muntiacus reevesi]|uniref:Macro domain-containing protein n=1 Tax=Muntiacus reevesi TaxID=9886 RepID=A0A5N3XVX2_MUNRE|nr:hypothetical protein FD755_012007 [Muntiacus reevesi]